MAYIHSLSTLPSDLWPSAGGKATSLARMIQLRKICVPEGYVILSEGFSHGTITPSAEKELSDLLSKLDPDVTYAVRSSAKNEDGGDASFAGQYETITNVKVSDIPDAVRKVAASSASSRVEEYTRAMSDGTSEIAVVIQRFVMPEYAGVLFTSDPLSGKEDALIGNYVSGEGEKLVSGSENAEVFRISSLRFSYDGPEALRPYAKALWKYCRIIRFSYGVPMDIEWAVSKKKVYILQARPITTLRRLSMSDYSVNGSRSGYKMLTRTNVGEIFLKPVSPMTFSVLEKINHFLGIPDWLDNINGQTYMNISVMCSMLISFGKSEKAAFEAIRDLVGNIPPGTTVPVAPFDRKAFLKNLKTILFPKNKSKLSKKEKHQMVKDLPDLSRKCMAAIEKIDQPNQLYRYWEETLTPKLNDGLAAILGEGGLAMVPLFGTRKKISKIAGEDMANRLCGGGVGVLDSMKPLLLLEDILNGKITREEYINTCGHRCAGEMELMEPRPYEDPTFLDRRLAEHQKSGVDLHAIQKAQKEAFDLALSEFKQQYPNKKKWIEKQLQKFAHANSFREDLRSRGVWIFCVFREYLRKAGSLLEIGDDVFMLTFTEVFDLLKEDTTGSTKVSENVLTLISRRKENYTRYLSYPVFPSLIVGPFDPDSWVSSPNRRGDYFLAEEPSTDPSSDSDVKGFPGAAGKITGTVRVVTDLDHIDEIKEGEILVTVATNIGWTLVFPKVSAVVTDIGAPLSHAAIVAREFGIPAVVGCGNATTVLHTGDVVTVDGAAGTVTRIS